MSSKIRILIGLNLLVLLAIFAALSYVIIDNQGEAKEDDVSVLLNAEDEYAYPSTTYVIRQEKSGAIFICGGTIIGDGVVLTAAHCTDDAYRMFIGTEKVELSDRESVVEATDIIVKDGWEGDLDVDWNISKLPNDMALILFDSSTTNFQSSKISNTAIGCNYEIVGFGTRLGEESINLDVTRQKQSIGVCIDEFDGELMILAPESNTGICFGDSGSPIFVRGTNEVVGVMSSIFGEPGTELCSINNHGIAVRTDVNEAFIATYTNESIYSNTYTQPEDLSTKTLEEILLNDEELAREFERLARDFEDIYKQEDIKNNDIFSGDDDPIRFDQEEEEPKDELPKTQTSEPEEVKEEIIITTKNSDVNFPMEYVYVVAGVIGFAVLINALVLVFAVMKKSKPRIAQSPAPIAPMPNVMAPTQTMV